MPIKEEPVRIEFQYEQEDAKTSDGIFNVEYFSETQDGKEKKYVKVTTISVSLIDGRAITTVTRGDCLYIRQSNWPLS